MVPFLGGALVLPTRLAAEHFNKIEICISYSVSYFLFKRLDNGEAVTERRAPAEQDGQRASGAIRPSGLRASQRASGALQIADFTSTA